MLFRAAPKMEKVISFCARNAASSEIDKAVLEYMDENRVTYAALVDVRYDENGAVTSITADTAKIDTMIAKMDNDIGAKLEEAVMQTHIPLDVLLSTELFTGDGPKISVHFFPINVVNVKTRHEFTAKGINQTLHTIYLDISVDIEILLPFKNRTENVDSEILLGQTLIVGGVPQTYVER